MHVTSSKRGRRALNDSAALAAIADTLVAEPHLCPTHAMRRVVGRMPLQHSSESAIRRLRRKWSQDGAALLSAARARRDVRLREELERSMIAAREAMVAVFTSPAMLSFQEHMLVIGQALQEWTERNRPVLEAVAFLATRGRYPLQQLSGLQAALAR